MTHDQGAVPQTTAAGRGRLAQVIATRGGLAAPEAPFVIERDLLVSSAMTPAAADDLLLDLGGAAEVRRILNRGHRVTFRRAAS